MSTYLAKKYANILDGPDINYLFTLLEDETSRADAARICGIDRRTVYDWDNVNEIRLKTKVKILRAMLERDVIETLKYLLDKGIDNSLNIFTSLISYIYQKAMDININNDEFERLYNTFYDIRKKNSNLINKYKYDEIAEMEYILDFKAESLDIDVIKLSINDMNVEEIVTLLKPITENIPYGSTESDLNRISEEVKFPLEFIKNISDIKHNIFLNDYIKIIKNDDSGDLPNIGLINYVQNVILNRDHNIDVLNTSTDQYVRLFYIE